jgi:hypothetical protein
MSALGQKQTYAPQKRMSALPPIATAKADFRNGPCPLYPRKRTCAVQLGMFALPPKADIKITNQLVELGKKNDVINRLNLERNELKAEVMNLRREVPRPRASARLRRNRRRSESVSAPEQRHSA